jgi:hypothetical protein
VSAARGALLTALLFTACSHAVAPSPATPAIASSANEWRVPTQGDVSSLTIAGQALSYCDEAGFHRLEAHTGRVLAAGGACPEAPASAGSTAGVTVRTPDLGPDDVIEFDGQGMSFPIEGHARDWASDAGTVVIVGTASEVLEFLPAAGKQVRLSESGASRVAVGGGWAAWWDGAAVIAHRL